MWSEVESQVGFIYPYLDGNFNSSLFSFYEFWNKELGIKYPNQDAWDCYLKTSEVSFIYSFKEFVIISEKPTDIKMTNGVLHNESGMSIKYADGFGVYTLNGVKVTEEIVMTPANKLSAQLLLKEKNAEVRREIVRKIGIERVCRDLNAKTIDRCGNYELLLLDIGDNRQRPYLKMVNPSIGVYHIEGVSPKINTVEKALNWRNGTSAQPLMLS